MQPARILLLVTLLLVLGSVALTLFIDSREGSAAQQSQIASESGFAGENEDAATEAFNLVIKRLLLFMAGGIAAAILLLSFVIPFAGDMIAAYFYNPAEEMEADLKGLAAAKVAEEDYEGAIAEYRKLLDQDPPDRFAIVEISNLYLEKLDNPEAAIKSLEETLRDKDWEDDDAAYLMFRMASIELENRNDPARGREILESIVRKFRGTRHAANAEYRIEEIDSAT